MKYEIGDRVRPGPSFMKLVNPVPPELEFLLRVGTVIRTKKVGRRQLVTVDFEGTEHKFVNTNLSRVRA